MMIMGIVGCGKEAVREIDTEETETIVEDNVPVDEVSKEIVEELISDEAGDEASTDASKSTKTELFEDEADNDYSNGETVIANLKIPYVMVVDDSNVDIGITYTIDGKAVNTDLMAYNYNFMGAEIPTESYAHAELYDIDKDNVNEIILKVYGLGNTLEDYAGEMYILEATDKGVKEALHLDTMDTPNGDNLTELVIWDGSFYLYTCRKESTDVIELVYTLYKVDSLKNGKLGTKEISVDTVDPMNEKGAIVF